MPTICRDCGRLSEHAPLTGRCAECTSPRLNSHPELNELSIAHIDCDSFYASVEKLDNKLLKGEAVIVGGGQRGVVAACCYIARLRGVHNAMPMFRARKLCPDAIIIRPNFEKYCRIGRKIKKMMLLK